MYLGVSSAISATLYAKKIVDDSGQDTQLARLHPAPSEGYVSKYDADHPSEGATEGGQQHSYACQIRSTTTWYWSWSVLGRFHLL